MVGVRGFEPPAPASRRRCSTRLSYTPIAVYYLILGGAYIDAPVSQGKVREPSQ